MCCDLRNLADNTKADRIMISWAAFAAVFAAFFVTHTVPVRPRIKARLQRRLGETGFTISYSIISLFMFSALIWATQNAPYVQLWEQVPLLRYVLFCGMACVCLIAGSAIGRPNPFSFGGANNHAFDPTRPGVVRFSRHPLLVAIALWAGLHLLLNGDLAHVILFGVTLVFACFGMLIIDRRTKRLMGHSQWSALLLETRKAHFFQFSMDRRAVAVRIGLAAGAFTLLLVLHPVALGVSPLPR